MLFGMCAVLMVVVAIASIALIYNSFSISLTERTRQFGLFKSIGATRFQVIVSVFLEAGFLAVSAIPAGLLIGCVGVSCVFRLLKNSFDAMINSKWSRICGKHFDDLLYASLVSCGCSCDRAHHHFDLCDGASHACWTDFSDRGDSPDKMILKDPKVCKGIYLDAVS